MAKAVLVLFEGWMNTFGSITRQGQIIHISGNIMSLDDPET